MIDKMKGRAFVFGNDVDTDAIIPARYLNISEPEHLKKHCMEDADPDFPSKVRVGDIIVAGKNFGCGSSREHAPISIKASGISCVIAASFARIFQRNSINMGLPIFVSVEASRDNMKMNGGTLFSEMTLTGLQIMSCMALLLRQL